MTAAPPMPTSMARLLGRLSTFREPFEVLLDAAELLGAAEEEEEEEGPAAWTDGWLCCVEYLDDAVGCSCLRATLRDRVAIRQVHDARLMSSGKPQAEY